jgi:YesN/AraC family two-component response regulator
MHAEHGQVAFDLLQRFPTDFDVVILDIVMPVMDGVEVNHARDGCACSQLDGKRSC